MALNDLHYAARTLRKAPVFTAAAVLTIALGVGANTAIFSVVNAVMIRPLPFSEPARLMRVAEKNDKLNIQYWSASVLNYLSWKDQTKAFDSLAAVGSGSFNITGRGDPEQLTGSTISPSLLPALGLQPVQGRGFREGEDRPGAAPVAMIGSGFWKRRFGGDPAIIGMPLTMNGVDYAVVGIAPDALAVLTPGDVWVPLTIDPGRENRLNHVITVIGRIKRGVTMQQAQAEMDAVASRVARQYPEVKDWGIRLMDFYHWFVPDQLRTALLVLLGAVVLVLLIASANVANLLLSRAASRQKEIAVRTAMGASRARLLRQLMTESVTLSALGGGAGLLAALWAIHLMNTALPPNLLPVPDVSIDGAVLLFALGVTLATAFLFGMAPAWHGAKTDLSSVLKQGARSAVGGARPLLRSSLVAGELALATVLLIGAALLVQSLLRLQQVRLGFRPDGLLTFQLALPAAKYPGNAKAWAFYKQMLESIRNVPGVQGAAISSGIPLGAGNYTRTPVSPVGKSQLPPGTDIPIDWRLVSPDFFHAMGIPVVRGRTFTERDDASAPAVMVVSQSTARKFWGADDPIGRVVHRTGDGKNITVIGVVGDVRNTALSDESPAMYFSAVSRLWPLMDVVVRTSQDPEAALPAIRRKIQQLDAELPLATVRTMDQWVSSNAAQPRLNAALLSIFACVAMLVSAIGIYGVLAYSVNQRTREIGLRMALGAQRGSVLKLIIREGMTVALIGIGAGLAAAFVVSRLLASLLFGVEARDPATFAVLAGLLALIALAACAIPAWRASRVDPMVALRYE